MRPALCALLAAAPAAAQGSGSPAPAPPTAEGPQPHLRKVISRLDGNGWAKGVVFGPSERYWSFEAPPDGMIDAVIYATQGCDGLSVQGSLRLPPEVAGEHGGADADPSSLGALLVARNAGGGLLEAAVEASQDSLFCKPRTVARLSVKDTGPQGRSWWVTVKTFQEMGESMPLHARCDYEMFVRTRTHVSFWSTTAAVLGLGLIGITSASLAFHRMATRPGFQLRRPPCSAWSVAASHVPTAIAAAGAVVGVAAIRALLQWAGPPRARLRRRGSEHLHMLGRSGEPEAELSWRPDAAPRGVADDDSVAPSTVATPASPAREPPPAGGAAEAAAPGSPSGSEGSEASAEPAECRVCRDEESAEVLIAPCNCTGGMKWVHRSCLDTWRQEGGRANLANAVRCEVCGAQYVIERHFMPLRGAVARLCAVVGAAAGQRIAFLAALYAAISGSGLLAKLTVGQLACAAPYDEVDYRVMTWRHHWASLVCYLSTVCIVLWCVNLLWRSHIARRRGRNFRTFKQWVSSGRNAAVSAFLSLGVLSLVGSTGYLTRLVLYLSQPNMVWGWDLCLGLGAIGVLLTLGAAAALGRLCARRLRRRRRWAAQHRRAGPVVAAEHSDSDHEAPAGGGADGQQGAGGQQAPDPPPAADGEGAAAVAAEAGGAAPASPPAAATAAVDSPGAGERPRPPPLTERRASP